MLVKYGIPVNPEIKDNKDLFSLPLAEYSAFNYPQIILNIFEIDGPELHYDTIKYILLGLKVPTHCGMPLLAVFELVSKDKLVNVKKHVWKLVV